MSLWKKIVRPGSGTQRNTARTVSPNQAFQPSKPRSGTSETSGREVITLAPGGAGFSAIQATASAWMISRVGGTRVTASNRGDFGDFGFYRLPLGEPGFDLLAE